MGKGFTNPRAIRPGWHAHPEDHRAVEYRSIHDLNERVIDWLTTLPRDLDLIVGIPRSGLLAANLLSLHLDLPMTDLQGLIEGRVLATGVRYGGRPIESMLAGRARILVVDDSVCSGAALTKAREALAAARIPHDLRFGAVFATAEAVQEGHIDSYGEIVPVPRVFEWNLMHTPMAADFCVDIDGVLCADPDPRDNDDGPRYRRFLDNARPLMLPRHEIGWLVTSRLEKYREPTVEWLARQGVKYRELVMMDYPDMRARQQAAAYTAFKADAYRHSGARLFIESAAHVARGVADATGKPVYCFDHREMLYPGTTPRPRHPPVRVPSRLERLARQVLRIPWRVARKGWHATRSLTG